MIERFTLAEKYMVLSAGSASWLVWFGFWVQIKTGQTIETTLEKTFRCWSKKLLIIIIIYFCVGSNLEKKFSSKSNLKKKNKNKKKHKRISIRINIECLNDDNVRTSMLKKSLRTFFFFVQISKTISGILDEERRGEDRGKEKREREVFNSSKKCILLSSIISSRKKCWFIHNKLKRNKSVSVQCKSSASFCSANNDDNGNDFEMSMSMCIPHHCEVYIHIETNFFFFDLIWTHYKRSKSWWRAFIAAGVQSLFNLSSSLLLLLLLFLLVTSSFFIE